MNTDKNMSNNFDNVKKKIAEKKDKTVEWLKDKKDKTIFWAKRNPELAMVIGSTILGATKKIVVNGYKDHKKNKQMKEASLYFYDPNLHMKRRLKRPLTNEECNYIQKMKLLGWKTSEILSELDVLA